MGFSDCIREVGPGDINFIKASWKEEALRQEKYEAERLSWIPTDVFMAGLEARISRILTSCTCMCACPGGTEDDWIAGYIVLDEFQQALHMLYVKPKFRKKGVATDLLEAAPPLHWYTQRTAHMRHLEDKWQLKYNPFPRGA